MISRFSFAFVTLVIALAGATGAPVRAQDEIDQSLSESGKVWYDKYCTPCHGPGGAPGKAVYKDSKEPVDLRTYVQRHGGKFPAADWLSALADARPGNVHAPVLASIRKAQAGVTPPAIAARGVVGQIARYIISVQTK